MKRHALLVCAALVLPASAQAGGLTLFASGEALATEGFADPVLTRDGWALSFTRILVTIADATAWRTDPPFTADGPSIAGEPLAFGGPFTVDLVAADEDDRVAIVTVDAAPGHWNALSFTLAPATEGPFPGRSLVFEGVATRAGETVAFTLVSADAIAHACGEYMGDERKGFVAAGAPGDLEITLHLDHLFGRADLPADDPTNQEALGFDRFAAGGEQEFTLAGLHLGHVGEGHCHVAPR